MRFTFNLSLQAIVIALLFLHGCKDSNNLDTGTDSVQGLWKLNSTQGDVNYIDVNTDSVTSFDYMGDSYDEGADCYEISSEKILKIDGSKFTFANPFDPQSTIDVEFTAKGDQLTVVQPFGDISITLTFTKSNANTGTFVPACSDTTMKAPKSTFFFKNRL